MTHLTEVVTRSDLVLEADPRRVLGRLFVPGRELALDQESRASSVLDRILKLPEPDVALALDDVLVRYSGRHRDLHAVLCDSFERIAHRLPAGQHMSEERRALLGAYFTHEYSIEGAALFNPSAVAHPDQSGLERGQCRFILSLRGVGEGHLSSIGFRTGVFGPGQQLRLDDAAPLVEAGTAQASYHDRDLLQAKLDDEHANAESAAFLIGCLPPQFDDADLDAAIAALSSQRETRRGSTRVADLARRIAACTYTVAFPAEAPLSSRVLWPRSPSERRGMEDARFVRFVDDDAEVSYRATYTAFDGEQVAPHLLETSDFRRFRVSPLAGPAARNKGLALFPRPVGGRLLALSRWDRETTTIASSSDGRWWGDLQPLHAPSRPWELTQTGNCGSPVETAAGWLVFTHGVGPMREYGIGALLLDLDDPGQVIGELVGPLLTPGEDERDGYVPNVVYSCGAMAHLDQILLPYGASDARVRFAVVDLPALLAALAR